MVAAASNGNAVANFTSVLALAKHIDDDSPTFTPSGIMSNLLVRRDRDRVTHPFCFTFSIELGETLKACFDMAENHLKK